MAYYTKIVVVVSNERPEISQLAPDRWALFSIADLIEKPISKTNKQTPQLYPASLWKIISLLQENKEQNKTKQNVTHETFYGINRSHWFL